MSDQVKGVKRTAVETIAEEGLQNALEEAVLSFEEKLEQPYGEPESLIDDGGAKWGKLIVAPVSGIEVTLPLADREHTGRIILVVNRSSGSITVIPSGDDTVNGATGKLSISSGKEMLYICQTAGKWLELWR